MRFTIEDFQVYIRNATRTSVITDEDSVSCRLNSQDIRKLWYLFNARWRIPNIRSARQNKLISCDIGKFESN